MQETRGRCEHLSEAEAGKTCCDCGFVGCSECVVLSAAVPQRGLEQAQESGALSASGVVWKFRCRPCARAFGAARSGGSEPAGEEIRHDALLDSAWAVLSQYVVDPERPKQNLGVVARFRLRRALRSLRRVLKSNPDNWSAKWAIGKTYEVLGDPDNSLRWFEHAYRLKPDHADVCREAGLAAMSVGDFEKATDYCRKAIKIRPADPGLYSNLALALLFLARDDEAMGAVNTGLSMDPRDAITHYVKNVVDGVAAGTRPRPQSMNDLRGDGTGS